MSCGAVHGMRPASSSRTLITNSFLGTSQFPDALPAAPGRPPAQIDHSCIVRLVISIEPLLMPNGGSRVAMCMKAGVTFGLVPAGEQAVACPHEWLADDLQRRYTSRMQRRFRATSAA